MMRDLVAAGFDVEGFDLTPEMVSEAKRVMTEIGRDPDSAWEGSVLDSDSFARPGSSGTTRPDAAICVGVLPHVPPTSDAEVLTNLHDAVRPGGMVVVEARNELFALFTLNRFTFELFVDRLIPVETLRSLAPGHQEDSEDASDKLSGQLKALRSMFRTDLPPVRKGVAGEPGYDEVLSRVHNPFELSALASEVGLVDVRVQYFHFHALPPMFGDVVAEQALIASLAMEDPNDWRGLLMASAFFVVGTRP
jgi:SAM-dependent methyltransferase